MRPLIHEIAVGHTPESLVGQLHGEAGTVLLRTSSFDSPSARHSFVAANPFLTFRSFGSRCEVTSHVSRFTPHVQFGNPWQILDALLARCELLDEIDLPFPLGGCFGYWGYDLKNFTEPKLPRRAVNDLELPDCHVGFYESLVVFDHQIGKVFIVSTGLCADGARSEKLARERMEFWQSQLGRDGVSPSQTNCEEWERRHAVPPISNLSRDEFISKVERAQKYIRAGDIYQVNLSQRLTVQYDSSGLPRRSALAKPGWDFFEKLSAVSPAPFSAVLDCGDFQIASSSPEQFLRMSGSHIVTRPIKGTRPRDADPTIHAIIKNAHPIAMERHMGGIVITNNDGSIIKRNGSI